MKRRWRKQAAAQPAEINITAFMNLMVILVPFLLITAVFSRITILNLNLPTPGDPGQAQVNDDKIMQLEVIVRHDTVEIGDRDVGRLKLITVREDGRHLQEISSMLQQIKARLPGKTDITLLLETDTSYQTLVEMMDTLRVAHIKQGDKLIDAELFPAISIGDAPAGKLRTADKDR